MSDGRLSTVVLTRVLARCHVQVPTSSAYRCRSLRRPRRHHSPPILGGGVSSLREIPRPPIMMVARRDARHHDHLYYSRPSCEARY
jgi:hypothetical protein